MTRPTKTLTSRRAATLAGLAVAAALLLAACGSSSATKAASTTTGAGGTASSTTGGSTGTTGSSGAAVASIKTDAKLGAILADAQGRTLYTHTTGSTAVGCSAACQTAWPLANVPAGTVAHTLGSVKLGTTVVGGVTMLTANGLPVYRFSGDATTTDAKGDGLVGFGGTWHVVHVAAAGGAGGTTTTTAVSSSTTKAPAGGSGY